MEPRFIALAGLLGLLAAAGLAGCGGASDDLPRQAVSGTVSFDGQPLAQGRIVFQPASDDAKVAAGAIIQDGRYAISRSEGPTPGSYQVSITSSAPGAEGPAPPPGAEETKPRKAATELIPSQYNSKTTLTAKVEAGKDNTFPFELKK